VDSLATSVINHFEETGTLQKMDLMEREKLMNDIQTLQQECRDKLFQMHKDKKEGKLIEMNKYMYQVLQAAEIINESLCLVQKQFNSVKKIEEHNE
jgi:hypothetical protein